MEADIGTGKKQEILLLSVKKLKADILLGVQRGIDVHITFVTNEKSGSLTNHRVIHFKGVHSSIWDKKKAKQKIIEHIEAGKSLISNPKYIEEDSGEI